MSIDFTKIAGWNTSRGALAEVKDSLGRVIWSAGGKPILLTVEKITADTYAGETTYSGETFILLDIYPKTNGTVKVTYGGLTKTITDTSGVESPNAQKVFFGTFNGVADTVPTPASGTLMIEGGYAGFARSTFSISSKGSKPYNGILAVVGFGSLKKITASAFVECEKFVIQEIPEGIEEIGDSAFSMDAHTSSVTGGSQNNLHWDTAMYAATLTLPSTIKSIGAYAFASDAGVSTSSGGDDTNRPCYLNKVIIRATTPPILGEAAFGESGGFHTGGDDNYRVEVFEVPKGCGNAYKTAETWSGYAGKIVEAS